MKEILQILLCEDDADDALIIGEVLKKSGMAFELEVVDTKTDYITALDSASFDVILSDNGILGFSGMSAFEITRSKCPEVPFIAVSGLSAADEQAKRLIANGVPFVSKQNLDGLAQTIRETLSDSTRQRPRFVPYNEAMEYLIEVVQQLSLARTFDAIMEIVRHAARKLTGADGATFVLREGDKCYYAEENAISPLWKGQRFPMSSCISGWAMLNRQAAVIPDIYADERIPADAYRPTFVKSLVMVPIRTANPIGAIGNYWAEPCRPPREVVKVLQALADTTSVAMENMQLYQSLERRVTERTTELETSNNKLRLANGNLHLANEELAVLNNELETFTGAVSHDLRAPLRKISTFTGMLCDRNTGNFDEKSRDYLLRIRLSVDRMGELIEDLLSLSQATRAPVQRGLVDISRMVREILSDLQPVDSDRKTEFTVAEGISVLGDRGLLRTALENLLGNALKYSSKRIDPHIEFGVMDQSDGQTVYFVRDNGAGFDMENVGRLFVPFQRLHSANEFPGTGVGLATVKRIIRKHGGRIWAEGETGVGSTFYFTLG